MLWGSGRRGAGTHLSCGWPEDVPVGRWRYVCVFVDLWVFVSVCTHAFLCEYICTHAHVCVCTRRSTWDLSRSKRWCSGGQAKALVSRHPAGTPLTFPFLSVFEYWSIPLPGSVSTAEQLPSHDIYWTRWFFSPSDHSKVINSYIKLDINTKILWTYFRWSLNTGRSSHNLSTLAILLKDSCSHGSRTPHLKVFFLLLTILKHHNLFH